MPREVMGPERQQQQFEERGCLTLKERKNDVSLGV